MKLSPLSLTLALLMAAGCGVDQPLVERATAPAVPTGAPSLSTDIVLSMNAGVDPSAVWADYDLMPQEVMPDGRTWRARLNDGGNPAPVVAQIQLDARVAAAELNLPVIGPILRQSSVAFNEGFPSVSDFFDQTLAHRLALRTAHTGSRGYGIKVAVLDTGIDLDHPVLASRILAGSRDFLDNDLDPSDLPDGIDNDGDGFRDEAVGHGTHVAGLVSLVAPSARILALRVLDSDGIGNVYAVASAIEYAVTRGARVINMSIGLTAPSAIVANALNYAYDNGVILVTAAGNNPGGPYDFPATSPRVWAVAAVDGDNRPASFTSAFSEVVLSAPGVNIESTYWNGGYAIWSGTSMAAPIVSGAAALVLSQNPGTSRGDVLKKLQETAIPFRTETYGMGSGVVNPGAATGTQQVPDFPHIERNHSR